MCVGCVKTKYVKSFLQRNRGWRESERRGILTAKAAKFVLKAVEERRVRALEKKTVRQDS